MIKARLLFQRKHGSALVVVMFVIAVVSLLSINLIYISNNELEITKRYLEHVKAFYIAEGGLERALAELKTHPDAQSLYWRDILDRDQKLGEGWYRLAIKTVAPGLINITSTGRVGWTHRKLELKVQLTTRSPVYDYAIVSANDIIIFEDNNISGSIFANGDVVLVAPHKSNITGNVIAAGNVTGFSEGYVGGSIVTGADFIEIPVPDENYYIDKARSLGNYYEGNYNIDGKLVINDVFFISGDFAVNGIEGNGIVFVKGNARINGDISSERGNIFLIVTGNLHLNGDSVYNSIIYNMGNLKMGNSAVINGCLITGDLAIESSITINFDPGIIDEMPEDAPGAMVPGIKVISWRDESSL